MIDNQTRRVMPHNTEAENAVIGSLMVENGVLDKITYDLIPEDFYHGGNRLIYSAIMDLLNAGKVADLVTVCEKLAEDGSLQKAGGNAYVAETVDCVVPVFNPSERAFADFAGVFKSS